MYYASAKDISLQQIQINIAAVPFLKVEKNIRPVIENTKTVCRDVMILSVLFNAMIRAGELIKLNIGDVVIDSDIPFLKIHGKGGKERMAPLSEEAVPLIKAYLAEYHGNRPAMNSPFIYTVQHEQVSRMSERNIERIVKKYADLIRDILISPKQFIRICCAERMQQVFIVTESLLKPLPLHWAMPVFRQPKTTMHFLPLHRNKR